MKVNINQTPQAKDKLASYPKQAKEKLNYLRDLVIETASEIDGLNEIEETLKWGEPSYIAKKGSTIRINWSAKNPERYAMYFNCNTTLVERFKMAYGDLFKYEKNRAILFDIDKTLPKEELKKCIAMALQYHLIKNKPL